MPADRAWRIDAGFEPGARGRMFRVRFLPAGGAVRGAVLFVHAFGEEMNKSRHVVAQAARRLAAQGLVVELPDLYGCGDSEGDLAQASVDGWLADLAQRAHALGADTSGPLHLWGQRAGALLAAALAQRLQPGASGDAGTAARLMLWQPQVDGQQVLAEMLRVRSAAAMLGGGARENVQSLRERLAGGETLEVAGYSLTPELAHGLEGLRLCDIDPGARAVPWMQISRDGRQPIARAAADVLHAWRERGTPVQPIAVSGPAFWSAAELEDCPGLIDATASALAAPS